MNWSNWTERNIFLVSLVYHMNDSFTSLSKSFVYAFMSIFLVYKFNVRYPPFYFIGQDYFYRSGAQKFYFCNKNSWSMSFSKKACQKEWSCIHVGVEFICLMLIFFWIFSWNKIFKYFQLLFFTKKRHLL